MTKATFPIQFPADKAVELLEAHLTRATNALAATADPVHEILVAQIIANFDELVKEQDDLGLLKLKSLASRLAADPTAIDILFRRINVKSFNSLVTLLKENGAEEAVDGLYKNPLMKNVLSLHVKSVVETLWEQKKYGELKAFFDTDLYREAVDLVISPRQSQSDYHDYSGIVISNMLKESLKLGDTNTMRILIESKQNRRLIGDGQVSIFDGLEQTTRHLIGRSRPYVEGGDLEKLTAAAHGDDRASMEVWLRTLILFSVPEIRTTLETTEHLQHVLNTNPFFKAAYDHVEKQADEGQVLDIENIAQIATGLEMIRTATR